MIKTRRTILAAFAMAVPVTGILYAEGTSSLPGNKRGGTPPATANSATGNMQLLAPPRQSVRFTADAVNRTKRANAPDDFRELYSDSRQFSIGDGSPSRGSGQRARQHSPGRPALTANLATKDAQSPAAARQSVRLTADSVIRAKHANVPDESHALYSNSKQVFGEDGPLNRGSGQRARQRSVRRPALTANLPTGSAQSLAAARESVRFKGDAAIREKYSKDADYSVALYPGQGQDFTGAKNLNRGTGHRARLRFLRMTTATANSLTRSTQPLGVASGVGGWQQLEK